ncbi:unnamed protein product [Withania somnifera]
MAQENVKFLLGVWLLLLYLFLCASGKNITQDNIQDAYGDGTSPSQGACTNCTICPYTCQSPPPPSGSQSYGVPPPIGYTNCPPAQPVTPCCPQYSNYGPPHLTTILVLQLCYLLSSSLLLNGRLLF